MQVDFHHAVTYVTARIAGFPHSEAEVIAYAAQYVDDATVSGTIRFQNQAMYQRISSSHKSVDPHNLDNIENLLVWLPFHFLPGNGGMRAGENPEGTFIQKIVCRPGSHIAQEMVARAIQDQGRPDSLHRLGITMHVYADTWAHQGFAGVLHDINDVDDVVETSDSHVFHPLDRVLQHTIPKLGHGRALALPDMPFLPWRYANGLGQTIERNNTEICCEAADCLCQAMQRYRRRDVEAEVPGIGEPDRQAIRSLFQTLKMENAAERHQRWLAAIAQGQFSFGSATIAYGDGAWKAQALGTGSAYAMSAAAGAAGTSTQTERDQCTYPYSDAFLTSNWKLFHDALQLHRLTVLHDILPQYGICSG